MTDRRRNRRCPQATGSLFARDEWRAIATSLGLSPRECQIVRAVCDGLKDVATAQRLGISKHTLRTYLDRLHRKLGVGNRAELLVVVFKTHLESLHVERGVREPPATEIISPRDEQSVAVERPRHRLRHSEAAPSVSRIRPPARP